MKRWCKRHPFGFWGEGYKQCGTGFRLGQECEEGTNEEQEDENKKDKSR